MAVANKETFWQLRTNGGDPATVLHGELTAWSKSGSGGSASGGAWVVTDQTMSTTPTSNEYTFWCVLQYNSIPSDDEVLITVDNSTHKVEIKSTGAGSSLKIVGDTTITLTDLTLTTEPMVLRVSLDSSGTAKVYPYDIDEDDDANTIAKSLTGASGSSRTISWGNTSGSIQWLNVLSTTDGAFSPDEFSQSDFTNDTLLRSGLKIIETLKESERPFLKNFVHDSSIVYGYDLSSNMISRIATPSIHIVLKNFNAPELLALGGHRLDNNYQVLIYITTRASNYKNAYRLALDITSDVFDEIMLDLGLDFNTDSITSYDLTLDNKLDNDEVVCLHQLSFDMVRRSHLKRR